LNDQHERIILMVRRGDYREAAEALQRLTNCTAADAKREIESLRKTMTSRPKGK